MVNAEIEQIEQVAAALSEKVGRREMSVADFDNSYRFLRADLQPLLEERERLNGGAVAGPTEALSTAEVARQWDDADTRGAPGDAGRCRGADQVRVLPVIPGTRANHVQPRPGRVDPRRHPACPAHHGVGACQRVPRRVVRDE